MNMSNNEINEPVLEINDTSKMFEINDISKIFVFYTRLFIYS